jgi:hypothetical protein
MFAHHGPKKLKKQTASFLRLPDSVEHRVPERAVVKEARKYRLRSVRACSVENALTFLSSFDETAIVQHRKRLRYSRL